MKKGKPTAFNAENLKKVENFKKVESAEKYYNAENASDIEKVENAGIASDIEKVENAGNAFNAENAENFNNTENVENLNVKTTENTENLNAKNTENAGSDVVVTVKNLYKRYSKKADYAIKDINFVCRRGEIVGLMGYNGAGKSTTLKCITGMLPFSEGEIEICGKSIKNDDMAAKKNFGFVADNHAVFVKMTGFEYISFMCDVYGVPVNDRNLRIEELQKVFKLNEKIYNLISSYSHGMKQKICMMGSIIHNPTLWILDEPMIGLDPRTILAVEKFMRDYVSKGNTILFSSHNLDYVKRICDRVIVIKSGVLQADKKIDEFTEENLLENYFTDIDTDTIEV
ncbi:MAG: ABC transporter ATP-binding protein [Clostridia bacterium]